MDENGDRAVSRDEYQAFFESHGVDQDMRAFALEDLNKDGEISYDEFQGPKGDPGHDAEYIRTYTERQDGGSAGEESVTLRPHGRISLQDDLFTAMDADADRHVRHVHLVALSLAFCFLGCAA
jgi:hypothetical protein